MTPVPPLSQFLPKNFDPARPIALIAGQGLYPLRVAATIRNANLPLRLIALEGETPAELIESFPAEHRRLMRVGQLGKMLGALEDFAAPQAIMAGQVTPRRLFHGLHPDWKAARLLFSLKRRNAETIFGAIADEMAKIGCHLLDARAFLDAELSTLGTMTSARFPIEETFLQHGITIAKEVARLDIGQGCVVRKGTVVAVEAFEGTDAMLQRAGTFGTDELLFVKAVKPSQDYRFDVPVFGMKTLENMRAAKIACAALEANSVILLDKPALLAQAKAWKIHLHGFS